MITCDILCEPGTSTSDIYNCCIWNWSFKNHDSNSNVFHNNERGIKVHPIRNRKFNIFQIPTTYSISHTQYNLATKCMHDKMYLTKFLVFVYIYNFTSIYMSVNTFVTKCASVSHIKYFLQTTDGISFRSQKECTCSYVCESYIPTTERNASRTSFNTCISK